MMYVRVEGRATGQIDESGGACEATRLLEDLINISLESDSLVPKLLLRCSG